MTGGQRAVAVLGLTTAAVLAWGATAMAGRPHYRVEPYEVFPGSKITWAMPNAINHQDVAAGKSEGPLEARATRWHPDGTVIGLDWTAFPRAEARTINELHWTAGLSYYEWDKWEATIWAPEGTATTLGGLWKVYKGASVVEGINDAGVAVGVSTSDTSLARAFRWTEETGLVDIGTLGGNRATAKAINNQGRIVGYSDTAWLQNRAFVYDEGQFTELGPLPGGTTSEALDINEEGWIVGGADVAEGGDRGPLRFHAVLWDMSTLADQAPPAVDLGVPFPGGQSYAVAVNNARQVVGNGENPDTPGDYYHPWIWQDGVMTLLQELIPPDSDWILYQVTDINDNGWIVGRDAYGMAQGCVLIPLQDGDLDYDGDVDADDHAAFAACLTGPAGGVPGGCASADVDEDQDVDLADFARLARAFGQP